MKNLVLILSLIGVTSANAMGIEETYDALTGDVSALITHPIHFGSNLPFAWLSNEDGSCKALGYEKAVPYSSRWSDRLTNTITVDANGNVTGGPYKSKATRIVCISKRF